jgi:hypothetical protein
MTNEKFSLLGYNAMQFTERQHKFFGGQCHHTISIVKGIETIRN